jgi:hypothetical protein
MKDFNSYRDISKAIFLLCGQREFKKYTEPEHEMQEDGHVEGTQMDSLKEFFRYKLKTF